MLNPKKYRLSINNVPTSVLQTGGKILNRVSGAVGDANTSYVYFALGCDKVFKAWALEWVLTATTLTLEFSNDNLPAGVHPMDATATQLSNLTWRDLTATLTGNASETGTGTYTQDTDFAWYVGRVKLVTTNATNTADLYFNRV